MSLTCVALASRSCQNGQSLVKPRNSRASMRNDNISSILEVGGALWSFECGLTSNIGQVIQIASSMIRHVATVVFLVSFVKQGGIWWASSGCLACLSVAWTHLLNFFLWRWLTEPQVVPHFTGTARGFQAFSRPRQAQLVFHSSNTPLTQDKTTQAVENHFNCSCSAILL